MQSHECALLGELLPSRASVCISSATFQWIHDWSNGGKNHSTIWLVEVDVRSDKQMSTLQWINRCMRYTWTYVDIFIIAFSYGVQFRFDQIFRRLGNVQGMVCPVNFWHDIRVDYVAVSELLSFLDGQFGHLILLACANDMYFIATQLFNGFQ